MKITQTQNIYNQTFNGFISFSKIHQVAPKTQKLTGGITLNTEHIVKLNPISDKPELGAQIYLTDGSIYKIPEKDKHSKIITFAEICESLRWAAYDGFKRVDINI